MAGLWSFWLMLAHYPKLVLADEPTGNLDEANELVVLDFFRQLHADGTTLIVVTHDPDVAALGDRQIVLNHGRIVREIDNRAVASAALRAGRMA